MAAAAKSKMMAMLKTPAHPILGRANFAEKGVHAVGTTVRKIPYATMASPM